jgi:hypothetical protein
MKLLTVDMLAIRTHLPYVPQRAGNGRAHVQRPPLYRCGLERCASMGENSRNGWINFPDNLRLVERDENWQAQARAKMNQCASPLICVLWDAWKKII